MKNSPVSQSSSGLGYMGKQRRQSSSGTSLASSQRVTITKHRPSRMTDASTSEDGRHRLDGEDTDSDEPSFYEDHEPLPNPSAPQQLQQFNRQGSSTQFSRLTSDASAFGSHRPSLANGRPGNEYRMISSRASLGVAQIPAVVTPTRVPMRKNKAGATRPTSSKQQQPQTFERLQSEREQLVSSKGQAQFSRSIGTPLDVSVRSMRDRVTSAESSNDTRTTGDQSTSSAFIPDVAAVNHAPQKYENQRIGVSSPDSSRAESCSKSISTNGSFRGKSRSQQHGASDSVPVSCWMSQKTASDDIQHSPTQLVSSASLPSPQGSRSPMLSQQANTLTPTLAPQMPKRLPPALPGWAQYGNENDENDVVFTAAVNKSNGNQPPLQVNTARPSLKNKSKSPIRKQGRQETDRIKFQPRQPQRVMNSDDDSESNSSSLQSTVVIPENSPSPDGKRTKSEESVKFEVHSLGGPARVKGGKSSSREKSTSVGSTGKGVVVKSLTPTQPAKKGPPVGRGRRSLEMDAQRAHGNTIQLSGRTIPGIRPFHTLPLHDSDSDSDINTLEDDDSDKTTSFAEEPERSPRARSRSSASQRGDSHSPTDAPQLAPKQGTSDGVARLRPAPLRHGEVTAFSGSQWSKTSEAETPEVVDLGQNPPSLNSSLPSFTQGQRNDARTMETRNRSRTQHETAAPPVRGSSPIKLSGEPCPALRTARDKDTGSTSTGVAASVDSWGARRMPTRAAETARSFGTTSSQNPMRVVLKTHRAFEGLASSTALPSSGEVPPGHPTQRDSSGRLISSTGADQPRQSNGFAAGSSRNTTRVTNSQTQESLSFENIAVASDSMRGSTRFGEGNHSTAPPVDDVLMDTVGSSSGRPHTSSVFNMSLSSTHTTPSQPPLSLAGSQRTPGELSTSTPQGGIARSGGQSHRTSQSDQVMYRLSLSNAIPEIRSRRESADSATCLAPPIPLPPSTAHMLAPPARARHGGGGGGGSNQQSFSSPSVLATAPPETPSSPQGNGSMDRTIDMDMSPRRNGGAFTNVAFNTQQRNAQQRINADGQAISNVPLHHQSSDSSHMFAPIEDHETPKRRNKKSEELSIVKPDSLSGSRSHASLEGTTDLTSTVVRVRKIFSADSRPPQEAVVEEEEMCCICLEPYTQDNPMMRVGCVHHFHAPCLMGWKQRSNLCPMCMTETIGEQTAQSKKKKADVEEDSDYNYARRLQEQFTQEVTDARAQRQRQQQQQQQSRVRPETPSLPPRRVSTVAAHVSTSGHGRTESPMLPRHRAHPGDTVTRPQTAQSTTSSRSAAQVTTRPAARAPESQRPGVSRSSGAPIAGREQVSTRPSLINAAPGAGHHHAPTTSPTTAASPNGRGAPANGVRNGVPTTTATKHRAAREERSRSIFGAISNMFGGGRTAKKK